MAIFFMALLFSVMALPQTVIYYSVNDYLKHIINVQCASNGYLVNQGILSSGVISPLVGAVSRVCSVFSISPLELMRTKLQSKPMTLKSFYNAAKSTVAQVC